MSFYRAVDEARLAAATNQPSPAELAASLSQFEVDVLDVASSPTYVAGQMEQRILTRLGCSTTTYYQTLNRLLDDERALAYRPTLINRLRRQRDAAEIRRGR